MDQKAKAGIRESHNQRPTLNHPFPPARSNTLKAHNLEQCHSLVTELSDSEPIPSYLLDKDNICFNTIVERSACWDSVADME